MKIWGGRTSHTFMVTLYTETASMEINFQEHIHQLSNSTSRIYSADTCTYE